MSSDKLQLKVGILTISDTRDLKTDGSGQRIEQLLADHQISVLTRMVVRDDSEEIRAAVNQMDCADVIITNGGTGIAKRDITFEALHPFIYQEIPGFGELFRLLSYQDIGSHAIASRALAFFTAQDQLIFALPGSTNACELAMDKLILPEIYHLIKERRK